MFSLRGGHYRASAIDERLRDHALFMEASRRFRRRIYRMHFVVEERRRLPGEGASNAAAPVARKVFDYWLAKDRQDHIVRPIAATPWHPSKPLPTKWCANNETP